MKHSRSAMTGIGIAICSLTAFTGVALAQESMLPQVNVVAPQPQAPAQQSAAPAQSGGRTALVSQLPPSTLVNVGPFVNVPAEAAKPIGQPVTATDCRMSVRPGHPYFVEFRARTAASYGHAFLFHGKLGPDGHFSRVEVAGLHPSGDSGAIYMMGHVLPVAADTNASYGDLDEQFMTARFCVTLTEAEYARVLGYIRQRQSSSPVWNAMTMNCTGWVGDVARFMGYKAPLNHVQVPEEYINEMHRLNSTPAQYQAYQAEMRRVNSIPVPRVPADQRVTVVGSSAPRAAAPAAVGAPRTSSRQQAPASHTLATAPLPAASSW
jgi:hypothetical protein